MESSSVVAIQGRVLRPTNKDWESYRLVIIDLYMNRQMTLRRLSEHMSAMYGFHATTKMYRTRFCQWKLRKNMTLRRAVEAVEQGSAVAALLGHDKTRGAESEQMYKWLHRLSAERRRAIPESLLEQLTAALPQNSPISLTPPSGTHLKDHYLYLLRSYVLGSLDAGHWPRDDIDGLKTDKTVQNWCSSVMSANWTLSEGKVSEARRFLRVFISHAPKQLLRHDPLLLPFVFTCVLTFAQRHPEYATQLLLDLRQVSEGLPWSGPMHPLRHFLLLLDHMQLAQVLEHAATILLAYINLLYEVLGAPYPVVQDLTSDIMSRLVHHKLTSDAEVVSLGQKTLEVAEACKHTQAEGHINLKVSLGEAYIATGKFQQGRALLTTTLSPELTGVMVRDHFPSTHMLISKSYAAEGWMEEAVESARLALVSGIRDFGPRSDWAVNGLIFYRKMLVQAGKTELARSVAQDRDVVIEELCSSLEGLQTSE